MVQKVAQVNVGGKLPMTKNKNFKSSVKLAADYRVPLPCWTCGKDIIHTREVAKRYHDAGMKDRYCPSSGYHPEPLTEDMSIDLMSETLKAAVEAFDELENDIILKELSDEEQT